MMDEDKMNANSEIRFIALELTKIALQKKRTFRDVAAEYVENVYELDAMLHELQSAPYSDALAESAEPSDPQGPLVQPLVQPPEQAGQPVHSDPSKPLKGKRIV
ncbi:MAG: hypothetical protein V1728_02945 [Candidatus Micrarchaeota archaeon]